MVYSEDLDAVISMVLMADPVSLSVVRQRFRRWLGNLRWPDVEIDDVVMAVNEAVSNAIEQIHPSEIGAEVRVAARQYAEPDGGKREEEEVSEVVEAVSERELVTVGPQDDPAQPR